MKNKESAILKDGSRTDEQKLGDLLAVRGLLDLIQSAVNTLLGEPARGNNLPSAPGKIEQAEEAVSKAGEAASRLIEAFHEAVVVAMKATIQSATQAFILPEDLPHLILTASRHGAVKGIQSFQIPHFQKIPMYGYREDISKARVLPVIFQQLVDPADSMPAS